ncbi:MAG TPA: hypothetical protein VLT33_33495 [Labilithrix sp.]|nr:hypothetical protein [Labilithrix sp.]
MGRLGQARGSGLRHEGQEALTLSGVSLASYKLRFHDVHVRAVPDRDEAGCPFAGPGVDLRGDEARAVLDLAGPVRAWLEAREPGVVLRSLSVDRTSRRVLITLEPNPGERPRVVRVDPPHSDDLLAGAGALEAAIATASAAKLRRRAR